MVHFSLYLINPFEERDQNYDYNVCTEKVHQLPLLETDHMKEI